MTRVRVGWIALGLVCCLGCSDPSAPGGDPPEGDDALVPRRVVVLAPAAAEMLQALDLLDRVVGIGDFGPWPEPIAQRASLGGYDSPNIELALELEHRTTQRQTLLKQLWRLNRYVQEMEQEDEGNVAKRPKREAGGRADSDPSR